MRRFFLAAYKLPLPRVIDNFVQDKIHALELPIYLKPAVLEVLSVIDLKPRSLERLLSAIKSAFYIEPGLFQAGDMMNYPLKESSPTFATETDLKNLGDVIKTYIFFIAYKMEHRQDYDIFSENFYKLDSEVVEPAHLNRKMIKVLSKLKKNNTGLIHLIIKIVEVRVNEIHIIL